MRLRAISIGYAVPRIDFDAVVHSVFRSAVNLRLVGDDRLLTILASDEGDLPQGILTDAPKGFSFEGLSVGPRGTFSGGELTFGDSLSVDLKTARRWEDNLLSLKADTADPAVISAWRCAWDALNDRQVASKAEIVADELLSPTVEKYSALVQRVGKSLGNILKVTRQCEFANDQAIGALIGLGIGLTPSGDDLLIGYMAGLWCSAYGKPERLKFLSAFSETVVRLSNRTNDISRTYLYHAARGYVSSRLFNLANAICSKSDLQKVRDCTQSAMQVGHTSGMETVTGLLFGLAVWDIFPVPGSRTRLVRSATLAGT